MTRKILILTALAAFLLVYGWWKLHAARANRPTPPPAGWLHLPLPTDVYALAIHNDTVWAAGKTGVYDIARRTRQLRRRLLGEPELTYVRALAVAPDGTLWIGHLDGLTRFDGTNFTTFTEADGLPDRRINAIHIAPDNTLWLGTWSGLVIGQPNAWRTIRAADGLAHDMVNLIQPLPDGFVVGSYVAPQGGITFLDPRGNPQSVITTQDGLPHNNITAFCHLPDDALWVGGGLYDRGGAARLIRLSPTSHTWQITQVLHQADGLAGEKVRAIFRTPDGLLWFGSESDGLALTRDDTPTGAGTGLQQNGSAQPHPPSEPGRGPRSRILTTRDGLLHPEIKCMVQDVDGVLWIGTGAGLMVIEAPALERLANTVPTKR